MVYVYTNNDEDLYELLILPVLYFAIFWMQNIFSGQSGKKLDKVSRDPRTGKGIIMVEISMYLSCWKFTESDISF